MTEIIRPSRREKTLFVVSLGVPLVVVGASAMAISYATLIDVARVHGLPLPELFPVLIDVGTVTAMVAAAQFTVRGVSGKWLAYAIFAGLSVVSIAANALHASRVADLDVTTPEAAAVLAAIPPLTLLAVTHLVMRLLPAARAARVVEETTAETVTVKPAGGTDTKPALHLVEEPKEAFEEDQSFMSMFLGKG